MKIYLAGASAEMDRVKIWMARLREAGHEITFDWVAHMEAAIYPDEDLGDEDRSGAAVADWRGVLEAEIVWVLAPENASNGAWVELGLSLARGLGHTIVSGPGRARCIFAALANEYDTDEDAFREIEDGVFGVSHHPQGSGRRSRC